LRQLVSVLLLDFAFWKCNPPKSPPVSVCSRLKRQLEDVDFERPVSQVDLFATTPESMGGQTQSSRIESSSLSLFDSISPRRMWIVSGLMSSHFVDHTFAGADPKLQISEVDVLRGRVNLPDGKSVRLDDWQSNLNSLIEPADWQ